MKQKLSLFVFFPVHDGSRIDRNADSASNGTKHTHAGLSNRAQNTTRSFTVKAYKSGTKKTHMVKALKLYTMPPCVLVVLGVCFVLHCIAPHTAITMAIMAFIIAWRALVPISPDVCCSRASENTWTFWMSIFLRWNRCRRSRNTCG